MTFKVILVILPLIIFLFSLQIANAATIANTFQITNEGSQQTSPFIYNDLVVYTSLSDIWGYDLKTNTNFSILEKENQQFTTGFYKNLIIYENSNPDQSIDVYMYNLKTKKDTLVAGGPGSQGAGVTNGRVVAYIDGGACGSLHLYDIHDKTTKQIVSSTCHPVRISDDTIVYPVADSNGTNVGGYDIRNSQVFDISTDNNFQESANIFKDEVVWVHYISGALGDYNAIKLKDLETGEVKTIYESTTTSLQWPAVSDKYVVWSESSAQHVNGIKAADLKTGKVFEVQPQGPHQNSHTMPSIWNNISVWMSFRTGNGDIYGSIFKTVKSIPVPTVTTTPTPTITQQSFFVVSDNQWKYSDTLVPGWIGQGFNDSSWSFSVSPSTGLCGGPEVILLPARINQNGAEPMWTQNPINNSTAYFRKKFTLTAPTKGHVRTVFDDDGEIYVNGTLVLSSNNGFVEGIQYADVSQYLVIGENIIGIKNTDTAGGCQHVQFELGINPPLNDDFRAISLNTNTWEFFSTDGGNYSFDSGSIVVHGGGSMFYIRSKNNPFPISGPFTVEFGIQYILVNPSGIGVALGFEQQNDYDPSNIPVSYWQDSASGLVVSRFGLLAATLGSNPDTNYHVGKIVYDGIVYKVFLDGVLKYTSPSSATAKSLWFGNPFCCSTNWTGFKLDYIKVTNP